MKDSPRLGKWLAWMVVLPLLGITGPGCSSGVDVTLQLLNPCAEDVLFKDGQCQWIRVKVSSLDPENPLHPSKIGTEDGGPIARDCSIGDGSCNLSGEELMGPAQIVDVLCFTSLEAPAVARATSKAMALNDTEFGVGTLTLNLLLGNINGFVETTVLDDVGGGTLGSCSYMGQGEIGRYGHASTVLADGRILITGGIRHYGAGVQEILATAEIFDPDSGTHQLVTGQDGNPVKMKASSGRAYHTATLLRDGKVLLAGGIGLVEGKQTTLQSAELFDPDTGTFGSASVMGSGRAHHTATTLATGDILVAGGAQYANDDISSYYNNAIIYRAATNTWEQITSNMSAARAFHAAVALDSNNYNGNVLIIGGENVDGPHNSVDIYDLQGNKFFDVNIVMAKNRSHVAATRLDNGEVMVVGGKTTVDDTSVDNGVEIFDPSVAPYGGFKGGTIELQAARMDHTVTTLDTGNVLVAGGVTSSGQGIGIGEIVLVGSGTYSVQQLTDFLDPPRFLHTATKLRNGWVFLAGGLPSRAPEAMPITQSMFFVPQPSF